MRYLALLLLLAGCGGPSGSPVATPVSAKASQPPVTAPVATPDPPPVVQGAFTITAQTAYLEFSDPSSHYIEVQPDQSVYMYVMVQGSNYIFQGTYDGQLVSGTWCVQEEIPPQGLTTTQMGAFSANVTEDSNNMPVIDARQLGSGFVWSQMQVDTTGWVGTRPSCQ